MRKDRKGYIVYFLYIILILFNMIEQLRNHWSYHLTNMQLAFGIGAIIVYCILSIVVGIIVFRRNEYIGNGFLASMKIGFLHPIAYLLGDGRKINKGKIWSTKQRTDFYNILFAVCFFYTAFCIYDNTIYWPFLLCLLPMIILWISNAVYSKKQCRKFLFHMFYDEMNIDGYESYLDNEMLYPDKKDKENGAWVILNKILILLLRGEVAEAPNMYTAVSQELSDEDMKHFSEYYLVQIIFEENTIEENELEILIKSYGSCKNAVVSENFLRCIAGIKEQNQETVKQYTKGLETSAYPLVNNVIEDVIKPYGEGLGFISKWKRKTENNNNLLKDNVTQSKKNGMISFLKAVFLSVLIAILIFLIFVLPRMDEYSIFLQQQQSPDWSWISGESGYAALPCAVETIQENVFLDEKVLNKDDNLYQINYKWGNVQYHINEKNQFEYIDYVEFKREKTEQKVEEFQFGNGIQLGDLKEEIIEKTEKDNLEYDEDENSNGWVLQYGRGEYRMSLRGNEYGLNEVKISYQEDK